MNEHTPTEVFRPADMLFDSGCALELVRSLMQDNVATSRALHSRAAAAALYGAKALTELADTVWSSSKMLNDKIIQNASVNAEVAFEAAQALAGAKSFAEVATIQSEFVQQLFARTAAQNREFFDLFARAADHIIETAHRSCEQAR